MLGKKLHFWFFDPEKNIYLYIGKWINGKFWISELSGEKSEFFLSWGAQGAPLKKFFWPKFFQTYPKAKVPKDFKIGATTQYVDFISNPEFWVGLPRPLGWPQTKTILAGQPYPWVGQTSQMSSKSVILAFRLTFVSCVEALLNALTWY